MFTTIWVPKKKLQFRPEHMFSNAYLVTGEFKLLTKKILVLNGVLSLPYEAPTFFNWKFMMFGVVFCDIPHKSCPILRTFNDTPNKFLGTFAITGGALLIQ